MMKRKYMILTLTVLGLVSFSLYGCSSNDTKEESNKTTQQSENEDTANESNDTSTPPADEENQEYLDNIPQTPVEEIQGEGTTDDEVPDLGSIDSALIDQECVITGPSGAEICTLKVSKAAVTRERDSNNQSDPEKVILINYSYTNSSSDPLLIDDMSFKLVTDERVCTPYYGEFLKNAEAIEEGESCSAEIAFEVSSDSSEGTLVFTSNLTDEELSFDLEF